VTVDDASIGSTWGRKKRVKRRVSFLEEREWGEKGGRKGFASQVEPGWTATCRGMFRAAVRQVGGVGARVMGLIVLIHRAK